MLSNFIPTLLDLSNQSQKRNDMQVSLHLAERYVRVWAETLKGGYEEKEGINPEAYSVLKIETDTEAVNIYLPPGHAQVIAKAWPDLGISDTEYLPPFI